jgi:uncharacterized membrane protein YgcG
VVVVAVMVLVVRARRRKSRAPWENVRSSDRAELMGSLQGAWGGGVSSGGGSSGGYVLGFNLPASGTHNP